MNETVLAHYETLLGKGTALAGPEGGTTLWSFPGPQGNRLLATVGLSACPPPEFGDLRIELCTECRPEDEALFAAMLRELVAIQQSGTARLYWFHSVALGHPLAPGSLLAAVFLTWPLEPFDLETATFSAGAERIDIVQAIPITLAELDYLVAKGAEAFEEKLEQARIDITDPGRPPAC